MKAGITALLLCACAAGAGAQTVYKCSAGGKVSYRDQPCADGRGTALAPPPAPDAAAAAALAKQEKARLHLLQKERSARQLGEEKKSERADRAAAAARRHCARLRLQARWADEDAARANKASAAAARLKAKRQGEALAVECPA